MNALQQVEQIMGQPYGIPPSEYVNTYTNKVRYYLGKNKPFSLKKVMNAHAYAKSMTREFGFYIPLDHTVFSAPSNEPHAQFTNVHEYTHGYISQRNGDIWTDTEGRNLSHLFLGNREEAEEFLVAVALEEGICDYVAIRAGMLEEIRNGSTNRVHMQRIEYLNELIGIQPANAFDPGQIFSHIKHITLEGNRMLKLHSLFSGKPGVGFDLAELERIPMSKYIVGYIAASILLEGQLTGIGEKVDALVKSPPKTFRELEELAFYS